MDRMATITPLKTSKDMEDDNHDNHVLAHSTGKEDNPNDHTLAQELGGQDVDKHKCKEASHSSHKYKADVVWQ